MFDPSACRGLSSVHLHKLTSEIKKKYNFNARINTSRVNNTPFNINKIFGL